jgi:hypothetical protein
LNAPAIVDSHGTPTKWSGNLYASTHCAPDGSGCKTAMCSISMNGMNVLEHCADGIGPQGPTTLAEFTLITTGADYYDVSGINGVNVPISMGPVGGMSNPTDPYFCMTPGSVTPSGTGLLACSWKFDTKITLGGTTTDQATTLRAVTPGGTACTSNSDCSNNGQVCGTGLAFGTTKLIQSCGKPLGWWTADELCSYTNNAFGAAVNCNGVAAQGKYADLYECNGGYPVSCYNKDKANPTCCGCPHWVINGTTLPLPSEFMCYSSNPEWQSIAEPWAGFVKNACSTLYSFAFDDATSTFTCTTPNPSSSSPNNMGYVITLCPGGKDGL